MPPLPPVARFNSNTGVTIYRVSCTAFPRLVAHTYLLLGAGPPTLVDTGSGVGDSTRELLAGLEAVRRDFGEPVGVRDIRRILITHGHHDHFGGLVQMDGPVGAEVGIHELDRWVLTSYEERLVVATKALGFFFRRAGVSEARQHLMREMYLATKRDMRSVRVDFALHDGQELDGLRFIHTPGHCPGQVCIQVGDVLLTADHVLPRTTPHQSPESITASTGLRHYLDALTRIERVEGVALCLGGHEEEFRDLPGRVAEIRADHHRKLDRILARLRTVGPSTMEELTEWMYPAVTGWDILLAIEEVGAHVEYLYEHGHLGAANVDEIEREENPAIRFGVR